MFIIFGSGKKQFGKFEAKDKNGGRYDVFYMGTYFSLFFIPLIIFSKTYYLSYGLQAREITKDEYHQIRSTGIIPDGYENPYSAFEEYSAQARTDDGANYSNEYCPICKSKLDDSFAFCPKCGQKQPKKA